VKVIDISSEEMILERRHDAISSRNTDDNGKQEAISIDKGLETSKKYAGYARHSAEVCQQGHAYGGLAYLHCPWAVKVQGALPRTIFHNISYEKGTFSRNKVQIS
jgi:hypothetical protein